MTRERVLARLDASIWILVYAGLLAIVLGIATGAAAPAVAWTLGVLGALATAAGAVLLVLRARMPPPAPPGAQSDQQPRRPDA